MRKTKIIIAALLVMVMIFAGCAKQEEAAPAESATKAAESDTAEKTEATEAPAEELPTLKFLRSYSADDLNTYPTYTTITEITGYDVEFDTLPAEEPLTKLNLIMATGGGYDLVTIPSPTNNYFEYANNGALYAIGDLLDEYGQNIVTGLGGYGFIEPLLVDGELYCVPQPNPGAYLDNGLFVRKDWLDAVGQDVPQSTEDFLGMLRAFKAQNPGQQETVIPYVNGPDIFTDVFAGAFGVSTRYVLEDGKLISRYNSAGMKDYLEYMNILFEEALLDNEFPINTSEVINEKIFSGKAGLFKYSIWGIDGFVNTFAENLPDAEYQLIGFPKAADGKQGVYVAQGYYSFNAIPQSSENAEHVIKFWDTVYQEENFINVYLGYEGEHWNYNDKNEIVPIQPKFGDERSNGSYIIGIGEDYQLKYWTPRLQKNENLYTWFYKFQEYADMRNFDPTDLAPAMDSVLSSKDECDEIALEYITKFISGDLSLDSYQEFLDKYNTAGGAEAEADLAAWYEGQ